jgi:3-hydroxyacyl-CoA dehydrogenase
MDELKQVVTLRELGGVAVICFDNPPVNALSREVRAGLHSALTNALQNSSLKILLIASNGNLFSAGADLNEFESLTNDRSLQTLQAAIENAPIPVVAAIQGLAVGGGLELAIACHYRIAHQNAKLGMPEIHLGIVPGAGGTQRLPRLIGPRAALQMMLSGMSISAADAKANGLIDQVADGNLRETALEFCRQLVRDGHAPRPTCNRPTDEQLSDETVREILQANARSLRGRTTQSLIVEAIKASTSPFPEGMAVEEAVSNRSLRTRESQALRHIFFAERESAKVPGLPKLSKPPEVKRVSIIGAGTMGSAIAIAFSDSGHTVTLIDNAPAALDRSRDSIQSIYASSVNRGRIVQKVADERIARITSMTSFEGLTDSDLVIEAVFEDMDLKKEVLSKIDAVLPPDRLIATNTSTLSVTGLARSTKHPNRVLGLHFFAPANVTKLLEIVRGHDTSLDSIAIALHVARILKKVPVVSGDAFGFIGNRMMLDGYFREAEQLLLEGASPMQVDHALERFGFAMGPQRVSDLGGNDVGTKVRIQLYKSASRPDPYFVIADRLTELGRLGQKTGSGFYRYEQGSREAFPDAEVNTIIESLAAARRVARRQISEEEIVERCLLALINVGAMVLEEGIAARASDIDVVWSSGYGFPRYLGGPMFHADTLGIDHVAKRIRHYYENFGHYWRPATLIESLAAKNSTFEEWDRERARGKVAH